MGVIDGSTPTGEIIKYGPIENFNSPPKVVADQDRRSLLKTEWIKEYFSTTTLPVGHGFNLVDPQQGNDFACYSFVPRANIPLKVIMLDNTQREDDGSTSIHGHGFLDQARSTWLKKELADGDAAEQLMIIAAHIPIGVQQPGTWMEWFDNSSPPPSVMPNAVTLTNLLAELHNHPNLLMWIAGHRHVNTVKAFISNDPSQPERGFWQVETSSLHDFPQQLRLFEINLNSDYTVSIVTTNVDPAVREGTPAATSRKYAVAAQQIAKTNLNPNNKNADPTIAGYPDVYDSSITKGVMDTNIYSYNAALFKQLGPAMKAKMQSLHPTLID